MHDAVPTARLVVDANGAWTPHQAVRTIRDLAPFDLAFVEQPVAPVTSMDCATCASASTSP